MQKEIIMVVFFPGGIFILVLYVSFIYWYIIIVCICKFSIFSEEKTKSIRNK